MPPILKANPEIYQSVGDLCLAGHAFQNDGDLIGRRATDEARRLVGQRVNELHEIIEGIRDEVIAENGWPWRGGCTEDEEDAGLELNETLAPETASGWGGVKADRKRGVEGKSVFVRVGFGGRRFVTKNTLYI